MTDKQLLPLRVELDEVSLSLSGWEVVSFQARLVVEQYGKESACFNEVAASVEVSHHPDDWQVRYNRTNLSESDYLPPIIWQLRSKIDGPLMSYQQVVLPLKPKELRAPKLISGKMNSWTTSSPPDMADLYIWVGSRDWEEIDGWTSYPSTSWSEMPVELVDQTTVTAIRSEVRELTARIRDNKELEITVSLMHPLGSAEELLYAAIDSDDYFGDEDAPISMQKEFAVQAPELSINIFDDTGFLLQGRELSNYRWVTVDKGGRRPTRSPSFIAVATVSLDDLAGTPTRVLMRLTDPAG